MSNIKLDIPDTRVVVRQPSVIVDRSKLPIQSVNVNDESTAFILLQDDPTDPPARATAIIYRSSILIHKTQEISPEYMEISIFTQVD